MTLTKYINKRDFSQSSEPQTGKNKGEELKFVVQKHDASHLHYDFRLEINGTLKSWAIPKGPSLNPSDKRLAMMVEDHPFDYKDFEGIIPEGNYGAGTVIIWDEGTYNNLSKTDDKKTQERSLSKQLKQGSLKFVLHGKKLKGEFALVRMKGKQDNAWLLIKHTDNYASEADITKKDKSVISHKTIANIAATKKIKRPLKEGKPTKKKKDKVEKFSTEEKTKLSDEEAKRNKKVILKILNEAPSCPFPNSLSPMLATLIDKPFDDAEWEYEIKWDGYRALSFRNKKTIEIKSRNNKSFNEKFYPIFETLQQLDVEVILDGEIVVMNDKGLSQFNKLQNWHSEADGQLRYYVFDVLWYKGKSLIDLPLNKRSRILKSIIPQSNDIIKLGFSIIGKGKDFFLKAKQMGLEGIIAKKTDSTYIPGNRSREWLKIKVQKRQEVIILGFTHNEGSSKKFSSLLLGVYKKNKLQYVGKVGTGYNDKMQKEMMQQFKPLIRKKSALENIHDYNKPSRFGPSLPVADVTWLKPELICEVSFTEITEDGVFRHPSFKGMREDKTAKEVVIEKRESIRQIKNQKNDIVKNELQNNIATNANSKNKQLINKPSSQMDATSKGFLNSTEKNETKKINGHELNFTNLDKLFWPKITKKDLLNYYHQVSTYILPYIKNRPQSLYRFPDGYDGKSFYQKDITGKVPDWAKTYLYHSEGDNEDKHFLVAENEASLLYMVNFGCIEINPWSSTIEKPENPDWCLLDLDPGNKTSFNQVIDVANIIHNLLLPIGVSSFPKTSGSTGIHIYIPLGKKYTYEQAKEFARVVVTIVHQQTEKVTSIERQVNQRHGKLYLDFLQNRPQATLAAPYSVRPKPNATVSLPLHWEEVKHGLLMKDFTLQNVPKILEERGDIFKGVLSKGINMIKVLRELKSISN